MWKRAVVAAVLFGLPVFVATAGGADGGMTEEEFLAPLDGWLAGGSAGDGEPVHPAVRALLADLGAAQARRIGARTLADPEIDLAWEVDGDDGGPAAGSQVDVLVSWPLPRPDRRRLERRAAQAGVDSALARLGADLAEVRRAWRRDHARWAVAAARLEVLADHGRRVRELAERTARRAEAGESSGLEARRLALAAAGVEADRARAEAEWVEAAAAVRRWRPDLPAGAVPALPALPAAKSAAASDSGSAPPPAAAPPAVLAAAAAELEEARWEAEAVARFWRLPRVAAGWQRQEVAGESGGRPLVGLTWTVPLFDRDRARRVEARSRAEALEARLELLRRGYGETRRAAREAWQRLARAAAEAQEAADAGLPAVEAATAAFTAGELDLTALLDTLGAARSARESALDLVAEALAAHRRLAVLEAAPESPTSIDRSGDPR